MKTFFKFIEQLNPLITEFDEKYPKAGRQVGGLEVHESVPNTNSISASFNDYFILKGIREIPISEFNTTRLFYAANDYASGEKLANMITQSKKISPLIVAVDKEGPYILEGAHRLYALAKLQIKYLPALVVVDLDD